MMELWISIAIAILLLALLLVWLLRSLRPANLPPPGQYSTQVLIQLNLALPSPDVVRRIFASSDAAFISREGSRRVEALFLAERKRLALGWLRRTREVLRRLMALHLKVVRETAGSSAATEIRLSIQYSFFVITYGSLMTLIFLFGPFRARNVIGLASRVAEAAGSSSSRLLGSLDPLYLGKMRET